MKINLTQEECQLCPIIACFTLAFALQLREKGQKNLQSGSRKVPVLHDPVL
jgi:hypothetical protein